MEVEVFKIKYIFLHCNKQQDIIHEMYGNIFDTISTVNRYNTFLNKVQEDNRWSELNELLNK